MERKYNLGLMISLPMLGTRFEGSFFEVLQLRLRFYRPSFTTKRSVTFLKLKASPSAKRDACHKSDDTSATSSVLCMLHKTLLALAAFSSPSTVLV